MIGHNNNMADKKISSKKLIEVLSDELKNFEESAVHNVVFQRAIENAAKIMSKEIFDGVTGRLGITEIADKSL